MAARGARLVRTVSFALAGCALAALIVQNATVAALAGSDSDTAAGLWSSHPTVQIAQATRQIAAATVMVSGEINGNVQASSRVELLETGIINGDVKAAVLTVAAGSRMRGNADFGWPESAK